MESIEWLDYMQNDPRIVENGQVKKIVHGWNSTEVVYGNYPVDGSVVANGVTYIYNTMVVDSIPVIAAGRRATKTIFSAMPTCLQ